MDLNPEMKESELKEDEIPESVKKLLDVVFKGMIAKDSVNHDVAAICEAIREQAFPSSYRKFDILVQKKPKEGRDYKYTFNDRPVVFMRYLEDDEYAAVNFNKDDSKRISNCNGIIASGVLPNGSVQFFPVELGFFERAIEKPEGY